jgi:hypothetical protein
MKSLTETILGSARSGRKEIIYDWLTNNCFYTDRFGEPKNNYQWSSNHTVKVTVNNNYNIKINTVGLGMNLYDNYTELPDFINFEKNKRISYKLGGEGLVYDEYINIDKTQADKLPNKCPHLWIGSNISKIEKFDFYVEKLYINSDNFEDYYPIIFDSCSCKSLAKEGIDLTINYADISCLKGLKIDKINILVLADDEKFEDIIDNIHIDVYTSGDNPIPEKYMKKIDAYLKTGGIQLNDISEKICIGKRYAERAVLLRIDDKWIFMNK